MLPHHRSARLRIATKWRGGPMWTGAGLAGVPAGGGVGVLVLAGRLAMSLVGGTRETGSHHR